MNQPPARTMPLGEKQPYCKNKQRAENGFIGLTDVENPTKQEVFSVPPFPILPPTKPFVLPTCLQTLPRPGVSQRDIPAR
jgi:hypothetical protein